MAKIPETKYELFQFLLEFAQKLEKQGLLLESADSPKLKKFNDDFGVITFEEQSK